MQEQKIYGRREGAVGHLVFNNPAKLNAVSLDMWDAFVGILRDYEKDPEVRCVVVSGAGGKAFVSGADISKFESERANAEAQVRYDAISKEGYESLYNFPKPTIAKITGYCIGGGMNLAACCDLRYCSDDSTFGVVETRFSNGIATMMMPWILGTRCRELIYTGDRFGADEAHRLGLVDRVFPKADLEAETLKIAKRMSRVAADCLKWNKRAINQTFETMGLRAAIQYGSEACAIMDATGSPEAAEFDRIRRAEGPAGPRPQGALEPKTLLQTLNRDKSVGTQANGLPNDIQLCQIYHGDPDSVLEAAHADAGLRRDLAYRRVHAGDDEHRRGGVEQSLLVAPGIGALGRGVALGHEAERCSV